MKHLSILILICPLTLIACDKKTASEAPATITPTNTVSASNPPPTVASSQEAVDLAYKQALVNYATMEDGYINDPHAMWATSAKASSTYGVTQDTPPASPPNYGPEKATGALDGNTWSNNNTDIGIDWLELSYAKPVSATEVRIVFKPNVGAEAVTKIELIDTDGKLHIAWSGISDVKSDSHATRTWFVRKFAATPYKAKGIKITLVNNLLATYKEIDAVQLVGE